MSFRMLEVRRLRILRELAARGTIAATAEALGYTAPAISQQLAALERESGAELLERDGRSVRLTDAAERLVIRTEAVLAELEAAAAELEAGAGALHGTVRLAAFPTAAATLAPAAMAAFSRAHPHASVVLDELEPEQARPALKLGEVDVAILHEYDFSPIPRDPGIEQRHLLEDEMLVALPDDHPAARGRTVDLRALEQERWVAGYLDTACHRVVMTACRAAGYEPLVGARTNDFRVVLALVAAGQGVALVPRLALDHGTKGVALRPSKSGPLLRRITAAVRAGGAGHPGAAALVDALAQVAAKTQRG
jgi:DNA-binding transcriptional LysR family regulator